jgi:hypothetical protein
LPDVSTSILGLQHGEKSSLFQLSSVSIAAAGRFLLLTYLLTRRRRMAIFSQFSGAGGVQRSMTTDGEIGIHR